MKRKQFVVFFLALVLLAGGIAYWRLSAHPPSQSETPDVAPPIPTQSKEETEEDRERNLLVGVWHDDYQGKRTMILNPDGSGTMVVELSGVKAALFASKLRFDMKWSLDGKKMTKKTVGGEPADKVNLILNTMGNSSEETVLELTESRLLLQDKDGKTKYDWHRVKKNE